MQLRCRRAPYRRPSDSFGLLAGCFIAARGVPVRSSLPPIVHPPSSNSIHYCMTCIHTGPGMMGRLLSIGLSCWTLGVRFIRFNRRPSRPTPIPIMVRIYLQWTIQVGQFAGSQRTPSQRLFKSRALKYDNVRIQGHENIRPASWEPPGGSNNNQVRYASGDGGRIEYP